MQLNRFLLLYGNLYSGGAETGIGKLQVSQDQGTNESNLKIS